MTLIAYMDPTYVSMAYDSLLICFKQTGRTAIRYSTGYEPRMVHSLTNAISSLPPSSSRIPYSLPTGSIIWKSCAKAEEWYANGHDEYYDDPTDRRNSLNKFVSYHLLPMELSYNQLTTSQDYIKPTS